jgi:hypothetical protein
MLEKTSTWKTCFKNDIKRNFNVHTTKKIAKPVLMVFACGIRTKSNFIGLPVCHNQEKRFKMVFFGFGAGCPPSGGDIQHRKGGEGRNGNTGA